MNTKLIVKKEALQEVLASTLELLHRLEVNNNQLYCRHRLRPGTLAYISEGKDLARGADKYLGAMLKELTSQIEIAQQEKRAADLAMIQAHLAQQMIRLFGN